MPPAITVVIPTHDRRETVLMAIESVLAQSLAPVEVLIVADGCTDGTAEAVRALADPRVSAIECDKGPGPGYGNRNRALGRATGEVVAYCSDDDLWLPEHLECLADAYAGGDYDVVTSQTALVAADDGLTPLGMDWGVPYFRQVLLGGENRTPSSAVSHRVELAIQVGGWRDGAGIPGDLDLWRRLLIAGGRPALVGRPTVLHFKAERREQPYERRILQNRRYLDRLGDPALLAALRLELTRGEQAHAADTEARALERRAGDGAQLERVLAHAETLGALANRQHTELVSARAEAERAARLQTALDDLGAQASEWRRRALELETVYAGGWWRLRGRVLALLRLSRRVRNRLARAGGPVPVCVGSSVDDDGDPR